MKTDNPYVNLEERAFWRTAIANRNMFSIGDLWRPKFEITQNSQVSTYGSCFAQHIGKSLHKRGYKWLSVTSRTVVWLFLEQFRLEFVPALHCLQGGLAAQG